MTVARIIASKGRDVVTMRPHDTLRDVIDTLAAKHIGALIIVDANGAMEGILSERDVVRAIAEHGPDALEAPVTTYMTKTVTVATESDTVLGVFAQMSKGRFRHMPVVDQGKLVGIISVGDAIKYRLAQMETEQVALRDYIASA